MSDINRPSIRSRINMNKENEIQDGGDSDYGSNIDEEDNIV